MKHLRDWHLPLLRKWLLSCLIGLVCLLVGIIMYVASGDGILLTISILLAILTCMRCTLLYRQIGNEAYEIIEGVCIKIKKAPLRRQRSFCLLTDSGAEHTVTLEQQMPIRIGNRYRLFYLTADSLADTGFTLDGNQFLALEDLGEFTSNYEESENNSE